MALCFENISFAYSNSLVLDAVNLRAERGEITCLLGPSGGGKSTLLRLAAGLEPIQSGRIVVDDVLLADATHNPPPEQRAVGLMFQECALFPHLTVTDNIAFGLHKTAASERRGIVDGLLEAVDLQGFAARYPHELSGGQQQRVALARSLAPKPKVLMMDEPYSSIDVTLRRALREAARHTLKQQNTTTVLVTHDPAEAMEMADTIAVLDAGKIVQQGPPQAIYEAPQAAAVARLFGDAQSITAVATATGYSSDYGDILAPQDKLKPVGTQCELVVRPKGLQMTPAETAPLQVQDLRFVGDGWLAFLRSPTAGSLPALRVAVASECPVTEGMTVTLQAQANDFFVF